MTLITKAREPSDDARLTRRGFVGLLGGLPLLAAAPAAAQTDRAATDILRQLAPHDRRQGLGGPARPARPMRVTVVIDGVRQEIVIDLARKVEITVFFAHDSAELRAGAQRSLDLLSAALQDDILSDQTFLIAGHTNAVGAYDYNVELSTDRAAAVREWLVTQGQIDPGRLYASGFGPDMPRDRGNRASAVNRRVEVIGLAEDRIKLF